MQRIQSHVEVDMCSFWIQRGFLKTSITIRNLFRSCSDVCECHHVPGRNQNDHRLGPHSSKKGAGHVAVPCAIQPFFTTWSGPSPGLCVPACPPCRPSCHRLKMGLVPCIWPCRFLFLHRLVWVYLVAGMNATVIQRFKFVIILGFSHDMTDIL